jgi:hypothetical protein
MHHTRGVVGIVGEQAAQAMEVDGIEVEMQDVAVGIGRDDLRQAHFISPVGGGAGCTDRIYLPEMGPPPGPQTNIRR